MRISDWSSDVCSSDLHRGRRHHQPLEPGECRAEALPRKFEFRPVMRLQAHQAIGEGVVALVDQQLQTQKFARALAHLAAAFDEEIIVHPDPRTARVGAAVRLVLRRSEEHTSELPSLMRISYAV